MTLREFGSKTSKALGPLTPGERLFQRFLIFKEFYACPKPIIVCEGSTDNVYLLHALHQLEKLFPQLIAPATASPRLKIRIPTFIGTRIGRILGLGDGGGSVLKTLVESYLREAPRFLATPSTSPFIVLVDNDSGSKGLEGVLKKRGSALPPPGSFVHLQFNLFVMCIPPIIGKANNEIEDLFDATTRGILIDGKSFNPGKDFDSQKHYSKVVFAHKVIRPNAATIDFSGFNPIFQTVVDILSYKPPMGSTLAPH